jgi:hypothetical protein
MLKQYNKICISVIVRNYTKGYNTKGKNTGEKEAEAFRRSGKKSGQGLSEQSENICQKGGNALTIFTISYRILLYNVWEGRATDAENIAYKMEGGIGFRASRYGDRASAGPHTVGGPFGA